MPPVDCPEAPLGPATPVGFMTSPGDDKSRDSSATIAFVNSWPEVIIGGAHEPYVDRMADETRYITRAKTVASHGTVERYPWSLVLFEKRGDPEDDEEMAPDYLPPPTRFEFFLGGSEGLPGDGPGGLGGGGGEIKIRDGAHIDTTAHSWPTTPPVIGYVIFTTDDVNTLRVNPKDTETRTLAVERSVNGFPKFCVFFPPFAVPGSIEALDSSGRTLHQRMLFAGRVPAGATFGGGD